MFCPKCGQQNPESGKFCRGCGTDLGNLSQALSAQPAQQPLQPQMLSKRGHPITYESALRKIFMGLAFGAVSAALAFTQMGRGWWFWLLIPAIMSLGTGAGQWVMLDKSKSAAAPIPPTEAGGAQQQALPPPQTEWASAESRYRTGDLVPPSVTDGTTRHLEMESESKTMTLPKQ